MLTLLFIAAAVLLFFYGLFRPEGAQWLKWLVGIVGGLGTLITLVAISVTWVNGHVFVIEGQEIQPWEFAIIMSVAGFQFWFPGIGLWLGRVIGRKLRRIGNEIQQTAL